MGEQANLKGWLEGWTQSLTLGARKDWYPLIMDLVVSSENQTQGKCSEPLRATCATDAASPPHNSEEHGPGRLP